MVLNPGTIITSLAIKTAEEAETANRLIHIFGKSKHALSPIVKHFGGQQAAFNAMQNAFAQIAGKYSVDELKNGIQVGVGPFNVIIRGAIVKGVAKISTAFIK